MDPSLHSVEQEMINLQNLKTLLDKTSRNPGSWHTEEGKLIGEWHGEEIHGLARLPEEYCVGLNAELAVAAVRALPKLLEVFETVQSEQAIIEIICIQLGLDPKLSRSPLDVIHILANRVEEVRSKAITADRHVQELQAQNNFMANKLVDAALKENVFAVPIQWMANPTCTSCKGKGFYFSPRSGRRVCECVTCDPPRFEKKTHLFTWNEEQLGQLKEGMLINYHAGVHLIYRGLLITQVVSEAPVRIGVRGFEGTYPIEYFDPATLREAGVENVPTP